MYRLYEDVDNKNRIEATFAVYAVSLGVRDVCICLCLSV